MQITREQLTEYLLYAATFTAFNALNQSVTVDCYLEQEFSENSRRIADKIAKQIFSKIKFEEKYHSAVG